MPGRVPIPRRSHASRQVLLVLDQLRDFPALPLGHREADNRLAARLHGIVEPTDVAAYKVDCCCACDHVTPPFVLAIVWSQNFAALVFVALVEALSITGRF